MPICWCSPDVAARCAATFPDFHAQLYAETAAGDGVVRGRIDLDGVCRSLHRAADAVFYLCGPQEMIDAFALRLGHDFAVPKDNIRVDQWE